ncbi:MAG: O-antigen ligase family protein [Sphingomonas bacterium]|nr:O-antigen ligase family protein [Sphingomonas bacterium]
MSNLRQAIAPGYLFLCIVMGGSAQGIFSNLALQLLGVFILTWAFLIQTPVNVSRPARQLGWLAAAAVVLVLVQLIPLPPALWSQVPGRQLVVEGYRLLGQPLPWMPLSLAPAATIATAMALLPPLSMLALILRLGAYRNSWLLIALLYATFFSVALGVLQVQSDGPYLYAKANLGAASGLFANANHMATLLLVSIPLLVALGALRWRELPRPNDHMLTATLAGGAAVVLMLGFATNQSFALLIIGGPVVAAAALQLIPPGRVRLGRLAAMLGLLLVAGSAALAVMVSAGLSTSNQTSVTIRADIWKHTTQAIGDQGVAGSGIGTFPSLYPQYENPATIERTYVNHAHSDYMELAVEGGIPAMVLMLLFLAWWGSRAFAIWRSPNAVELARAASIASAAILLHSLVDYPLRTAAIATSMAMALALMADPGGRRHKVRLAELRPTRHLTL